MNFTIPELEEHKAIVAAFQHLQGAAERAGRGDVDDFDRRLVQHARTGEEVMYPAAVIVGRHVRQLLGQAADPRVAP